MTGKKPIGAKENYSFETGALFMVRAKKWNNYLEFIFKAKQIQCKPYVPKQWKKKQQNEKRKTQKKLSQKQSRPKERKRKQTSNLIVILL